MAISTANAGTQTASACVACRCSHPIRYHLLPYLECFEVVDEDVRDPEVVDEEQVDRMELLAFLRTAAAVAKALVLKSHIHCRETPMSATIQLRVINDLAWPSSHVSKLNT